MAKSLVNMDKGLCGSMKIKNKWQPVLCEICKDREKCEEEKTAKARHDYQEDMKYLIQEAEI